MDGLRRELVSSQNFHPPERRADLAGESIRKLAGDKSRFTDALCPVTHWYMCVFGGRGGVSKEDLGRGVKL